MTTKPLMSWPPGTRFFKDGFEYVLTKEYGADQCPKVVRLHDGEVETWDGYDYYAVPDSNDLPEAI
jgi:hypothetical protein